MNKNIEDEDILYYSRQKNSIILEVEEETKLLPDTGGSRLMRISLLQFFKKNP